MNRYRFNFKEFNFEGLEHSKDVWFIGEGSYDPATGLFTGDMTLDFAHHWGQEFKDFIPKYRKECGTAVPFAWHVAYDFGYVSDGTFAVVSALPITNVSQIDANGHTAKNSIRTTSV